MTVPTYSLPNVTSTNTYPGRLRRSALTFSQTSSFFNLIFISHYFKSKRLLQCEGNGWSRSNGNVAISEDGLFASNTSGWKRIFAEKGFPISVADCRMDDFPGTICYYYEVKSTSERCVILLMIGLYRE
jgi:hypothetical protein